MITTRFVLLFIVFFLLIVHTQAQQHRFHLIPLGESWRLEAKAGSAMMLSEVPEKYLDRFNKVNIPVYSPGLDAAFGVRKAITGHLEMGYQLSYISLNGDVTQDTKTYRVHTQGLEHNYLLLLNLLRTDYYMPRNNCFIYYKVSAISLKNSPKLRLPDGNLQYDPAIPKQQFFMDNAAVGTGVGLGFNHQVTTGLSFIATAEYCRTSDVASDVYKIHKIFYNSPNTGNHYTTLTLGVCYTFDMMQPSKGNVSYSPSSRTKFKKRKSKWFY